jgi:hypothetical protein
MEAEQRQSARPPRSLHSTLCALFRFGHHAGGGFGFRHPQPWGSQHGPTPEYARVRIDSASASILETQRKAFFALRSSASSRLQLGFAVRRLRKATLAVVPISRRRRSGSCATAMMMAAAALLSAEGAKDEDAAVVISHL